MTVGFAWSVRFIALLMLVIFSVPVLGLRMRSGPSEARRLLDLEAWKEWPFFLTGLCFFLLFLGVDIPAFYVELYGIDQKLLSDNQSFYLLPILNTGSFFGRLVSFFGLRIPCN